MLQTRRQIPKAWREVLNSALSYVSVVFSGHMYRDTPDAYWLYDTGCEGTHSSVDQIACEMRVYVNATNAWACKAQGRS